MRGYAARYKDEHGALPSTRYRREAKGRPAEQEPCFVCGEGVRFADGNPSRRPIHKRCRSEVPTWLWRGEPGPRQNKARRLLERAAAGSSGGKRVFVQGACSWCGEQFLGPNAVYCSDLCKDAAKLSRRNPLKFNPSPIDRRSVYERDGWTCQLCYRPVEPGAKHPDPWSASLDHIVPQSKMVVPDHSSSNLRLSHLICNSLRRDEVDMTVEQIRGLTESRWEVSYGARV